MFAHVLLPTDGSKLSENAIRKGVQLAKSMKARVTGLCVVPKLRYYNYDSEIPGDIKEKAEKECRAMAQAHLDFVRKAAEEAGVPCQLFSFVPVKRSHSVCAQGGINASVNTKGEGDSPAIHFYETVKGGDFLANQPLAAFSHSASVGRRYPGLFQLQSGTLVPVR